ncbi:MAG: thrombospondin type 3 repeat-containing protein [Bradymonadaceae bacterium]
MKRSIISLTILAISLCFSACTDVPPGDAGGIAICSGDDRYNEISGKCEPPSSNQQPDVGSIDDATTGPETGGENNSQTNPGEYDPWEDYSGDGIPYHVDNCPFDHNPDQLDTDGDGVGDVCDNCPTVANADQAVSPDNPLDERGIQMGDACAPGVIYFDPEMDTDGDGVPDIHDNCPTTPNPDQTDTSGDGVGDACDNCPNHFNPEQTASPGNPVDSRGIVMGDACVPEPGNIQLCAAQESEFERLAPNVFLTVDESGSMGWSDTGEIGTRMQRAKQGLVRMAELNHSTVRFGLSGFGGACGSVRQYLSMGSYTEAQLVNAINNLNASGGTPMDSAVVDIRVSDRVSDPTDPFDAQRAKVAILIGDGDANNCACNPESGTCTQKVIKELERLYQEGVPTYIVGFNFSTNTFNDFAEAGGTDAPGPNRYYLATDGDTLAAAIQDIANLLVSCSYTLADVPPDPNQIWVSINDTYLSESEFSYDVMDNTVTLSTQACDSLRGLDEQSVGLKIELGCGGACVPEEPRALCDLYYETCGADYPCDSCSPEVCDGTDNNCNGIIDEGCPDCVLRDGACTETADCCEPFECREGICLPPCAPFGVVCRTNIDCCSGTCAITSGSDVGICIAG